MLMASHESSNSSKSTKNEGMPATVNNEPCTFRDAPQKPDGDPWEILFKPAIEADAARCAVWKEEVQTLLIFAGLFSAVVTAFVIESYKFLQPDPNIVIVGLLFHIANGLNNSFPFPPSVNAAAIDTPFMQTPSSVRINIFWFLSLVLSLTTVLIGTISLQWLREHQSYPGFSAKEKVAILHMRTDALNTWWVPQIFATLPVLLQAALTLFLVGLVDFALPLGHQLTIAVWAVVGFTLLFLAVTTILPTCQTLLFFTGLYPLFNPPDPCTFKSPQSYAVLAISTPFIWLVSWTVQAINIILGEPLLFRRYTILAYLRNTLRQKTWATSDRKWLDLRDGYHQCILDKDPDLYWHQQEWLEEFPLHDLSQVLMETSQENPSTEYTKGYLGAVVHCFEEVSRSVWTNQTTKAGDYQRKDRRSKYFERLLGQSSCSLADWLIHGGVYKLDQVARYKLYNYIKDAKTILFHQDQMCYFLKVVLQVHTSPDFEQYLAELWTFMITTNDLVPLTPVQPLASVPNIIGTGIVRISPESIQSVDRESSTTERMLDVVFMIATSHHIAEDPSLHAPCAQSNMAQTLHDLAYLTDEYLRRKRRIYATDTLDRRRIHEIDTRYATLFRYITNHLNDERAGATSNVENSPSVLFYLTTVFTWELLDWTSGREALSEQNSSFGEGLRSLLEALLKYKGWIKEHKNGTLERRFAYSSYSATRSKFVDRFSDECWDMLFEWGRRIELEVDNNEIDPTEEYALKPHIEPLLEEVYAQENAIYYGGSPPLLASSMAVVSNLAQSLDLGDPISIQLSSRPLSSTLSAHNHTDYEQDKGKHITPTVSRAPGTYANTPYNSNMNPCHPLSDPYLNNLNRNYAAANERAVESVSGLQKPEPYTPAWAPRLPAIVSSIINSRHGETPKLYVAINVAEDTGCTETADMNVMDSESVVKPHVAIDITVEGGTKSAKIESVVVNKGPSLAEEVPSIETKREL